MRSPRVPLLLLAALSAGVGLRARSASADVPAASAAPPAARSDSPSAPTQSLFDPARHMHVSEVKPGMTGYGLTVFHGAKIERFDVEVLSVLHNFNPHYDVVLIRCKNAFLEHTGSIAGMSGSPIFLKDGAGHDRMIGAFAYGWPLTKDPIAGVQPIEYMLALPPAPRNKPTHSKSPTAAEGAAQSDEAPVAHEGEMTWSLKDAGLLPMMWRAKGRPWYAPGNTRQALPATTAMIGNGDAMPRLQPLATPLMTSGLPPAVMDQMAGAFRAYGLVPLQAGVGGGSASATDAAGTGMSAAPEAKLEPGSVLAVPLLTGDIDMTAVGTTTEVIGDRVWGFGHPFNNEGRVSLPMGAGVVNGIIPNIQTSFKLGSLTQMAGTLTTDASVGVSGREGKTPPTVPMELTIAPADGSEPRVYHFHAAQHPRFTPLIAAAAFGGALSGSSELPQYNTIDYDLNLTFANGHTVRLANRAANGTPADIFGDAIAVIQAASDNPFQRVMLKNVTGSIKVTPTAQLAQIEDVHLPKSKYRPGEEIKAFVTYQLFREGERTMPVELELPRDLRPGVYQLVISDAQRYFLEQQQTEPFRFSAQNIKDVFAVLDDATKIRENALYLRLLRQPDGIAIGRTALQRLPSSRREVLMGAGRSDTTAFVSSTVKIIPTDLVMSGSAEFAITIEAGAKVAVGTPTPARVPTIAHPSKAEEPHHAAPPSAKETPGAKETPKEAPKSSDAPRERGG